MTERRCETCIHFVGWQHSFLFEPEGVCTCPLAASAALVNREVRRHDGQKCQTWAAREVKP